MTGVGGGAREMGINLTAFTVRGTEVLWLARAQTEVPRESSGRRVCRLEAQTLVLLITGRRPHFPEIHLQTAPSARLGDEATKAASDHPDIASLSLDEKKFTLYLWEKTRYFFPQK